MAGTRLFKYSSPATFYPLAGRLVPVFGWIAAALCAAGGVEPVVDPTNTDPRHLRNRLRHDVLPLLADVAGRDVGALLARSAEVLRDDAELIDVLLAPWRERIDPSDARALAAEPPVGRRLLRVAHRRRLPARPRHPGRAWQVVTARHRLRPRRGRRLERTDQRLAVSSPAPRRVINDSPRPIARTADFRTSRTSPGEPAHRWIGPLPHGRAPSSLAHHRPTTWELLQWRLVSGAAGPRIKQHPASLDPHRQGGGVQQPGGYGDNHRRVRRQEESSGSANGFGCVVSIIQAPHNLHTTTTGVTYRHRPFNGAEARRGLAFYRELHDMLKAGTKVLIHGEEVGDRLIGVMGGYIRWSGLVDDDTQAITITERIAERQLDPFARNLILNAKNLRS